MFPYIQKRGNKYEHINKFLYQSGGNGLKKFIVNSHFVNEMTINYGLV